MENYIEYHCRYDKSSDICGIRKNEGYMINGTLEETRNIIKNMILERNKNSIRVIPPFNESCLPYYCINGECFKQSNTERVNSIIFDSIKKEINETNFNNMIICIFMVLNVSPRANNPPPIPYIDMYKFNRFYYKIINNQPIDKKKFKDTLQHLYSLITEHFKNKTQVLRNTQEFKYFEKIKDFQNSQFRTIVTNLTQFKELIDRNNAASAVGTLEFLDMVSKYYTTSIMCKKDYVKTKQNYLDLLESSLSQIIGVRGGKKNKIKSNKSKSMKSEKVKKIKSKKSKKLIKIKSKKSIKSKK